MYLTKARPTLTWDQALLSFHLARFLTARQNWKVLHLMQYVYTWTTLTTCFQNTQILLHVFRNTTALSRLPTSQHAARNTASAPWKTPIVHSCINVLFIWAQTLHSTPGPSPPIRGHIPCILVGTKRVSQLRGQILEKPLSIKYRWPRIVYELLLSPAIKDLCENSGNTFKKINSLRNFQ